MVFAPWDALPQRHKTTDLVRAKITFFLTQVVILDKCSFLWSARLGQSLIKCLPFSSHTTHGSKNFGSEGAVFHIQYALVVLTPSLSSWKGQLHLWFSAQTVVSAPSQSSRIEQSAFIRRNLSIGVFLLQEV